MNAKYSKSELQHIEEIEKNEWKSVGNKAAYARRLKTAAKTTMLKDKRMNIRIAGKDIELLKTRALEDGIPYQTLVSSILHKYVTGKLVEK
jgi:predicted DNA binding CopG/RHH family protein